MASKKQEFEEALGDVVRELENCSPELLARMIRGFMEDGMTCSAATRLMAKFKADAKELLEVSRSMGEPQ